MYKKLAIIKCMDEIDDIPAKFPFLKLMSKKYISKYILKKLPLKVQSTTVFDKEILEIYLPIITSIIPHESEEYIKTVINKFNSRALKYNISVAVLSKELIPYKAYFDMLIGDEKEIQYLYMDKIIKQLVENLPLDEKDIHYGIIDSDDQKAKYIMDYLARINNLTIMTSNPEAYKATIEDIYNDTGLAIQITDKVVNQQIDSDIIINCSEKKDKMFYCFKDDAYVIDVISGKTKIIEMLTKRETLKVINHVDMYFDHQLMSKSLLHSLMLYENRLIRNVHSYGYKTNMKDKISKIKEQYPIRVGSMYQLNKILIENEL